MADEAFRASNLSATESDSNGMDLKEISPVRLIAGEGCVTRNASGIAAFGKRFLIVTGKSSANKCGAFDDIKAAIASFGGEYIRYDRIGQNPLLSSCAEAGAAGFDFKADAVIGIGGGSPLDAAKAAAVFAANPGIDEAAFYAKEWANKPLPIILVGTTAGTGSEVTAVSVLTDSKGRKHSISDTLLYASLSFGDSRYTKFAGLELTLTTGIDAVAHCVESMLNKKAVPASEYCSVEGLKLLVPGLREILSGKDSEDVRRRLYEGSILGGIAISYTGTCFPHNVGYFLTEQRGLPHGFACAVFMEDLLNWAHSVCPERLDKLLETAGTSRSELSALAAACLEYSGAKDISFTAEDIEKALPRWENAGAVKNTAGNFGIPEIRKILTDRFTV